MISDKNTIGSCEKCLNKWKNFGCLTKEELNYVNEHRYEATFNPGEIMIKQGSPSSNAMFLISGLAKVYIEGAGGKSIILSIAKPGRLLMGPGAYVNSRHTYTVAALTRTQACFISFDVFRHLVKTNGNFAEGLLIDVSTKSLRTHNRMINLSQKKMPGRIAEALLYFADNVFGADDFDMILSRQELGEYTNMAKESVVRILKDFEEAGVILSDSSKIKILDKNKLISISEIG